MNDRSIQGAEGSRIQGKTIKRRKAIGYVTSPTLLEMILNFQLRTKKSLIKQTISDSVATDQRQKDS